MKQPRTVSEILEIKDLPVVCINDHGLFTFVNQAFEKTYGWSKEDLINKPVTTIMPPEFREAHTIGFSRFLITEKAKVAGKPLPLAILHKNGKVADAEHFILGEKQGNSWRFAATIKPQ